MIEKRTGLNGQTYRVRLRLSGLDHSKTFQRRVDAERWERSVKSKHDLGECVVEQTFKSKVTLGEIAERWLKAAVDGTLKPKTRMSYQSHMNRDDLKCYFGIPISSIQMEHGEKLKQALLGERLSPKTINGYLTTFRQILEYGIKIGEIKLNPIRKIPPITESEHEFTFLYENEVERLLENNRTVDCYPVIFVAVSTGMRLGEILSLHWDQIDFHGRILSARRTINRFGLQATKASRIRRIPLNSELLEYLRQLKSQTKGLFVIPQQNSLKPFDVEHFCQRHFVKALERASVRRIRFHDLRHTFATLFVGKGGSLYHLKEILGHKDFKDTCRYAHLADEHLKESAEVIQFKHFENHCPKIVPRTEINEAVSFKDAK